MLNILEKALDEPTLPDEADHFEKQIQLEVNEQHRKLRQKAQAIFASIKGRSGVRSVEDLARLMAKVTGDYETGKFLLEQLGAHRFIDYETTLTLAHIREQLLAQIDKPTMAEKLAADTAVIAYHNILRLQAWIGNISLVVERELFGQAPLDEIHGPEAGQRLAEELRRLEHQIFPLMDRAHKMLIRSLGVLAKSNTPQNCLFDSGRG